MMQRGISGLTGQECAMLQRIVKGRNGGVNILQEIIRRPVLSGPNEVRAAYVTRQMRGSKRLCSMLLQGMDSLGK